MEPLSNEWRLLRIQAGDRYLEAAKELLATYTKLTANGTTAMQFEEVEVIDRRVASFAQLAQAHYLAANVRRSRD